MYIGIIGLGRMGEAIAHRFVKKGVQVSGYDLSEKNCQIATQAGVHIETSLEQLIKNNALIWIMVPVDAVDTIIEKIQHHAKPETIVIDGGNSKFTVSQKRYKLLKNRQLHFLDCGTSGGVWGKENGFCLMVGGDIHIFEKSKPYFDIIAAPNAVLHTGPAGSGHYVKMIHNGIEYGIMQAYAEGFHILHDGEFKDKINLEKIAAVWNNGSVIRSWLLQLTHDIFKEQKNFGAISGVAAESGMGLWTVQEAKKQKIPAPVIEASYNVRLESQKTGGNFATKLIALLRNKFGGHTVALLNQTKKSQYMTLFLMFFIIHSFSYVTCSDITYSDFVQKESLKSIEKQIEKESNEQRIREERFRQYKKLFFDHDDDRVTIENIQEIDLKPEACFHQDNEPKCKICEKIGSALAVYNADMVNRYVFDKEYQNKDMIRMILDYEVIGLSSENLFDNNLNFFLSMDQINKTHDLISLWPILSISSLIILRELINKKQLRINDITEYLNYYTPAKCCLSILFDRDNFVQNVKTLIENKKKYLQEQLDQENQKKELEKQIREIKFNIFKNLLFGQELIFENNQIVINPLKHICFHAHSKLVLEKRKQSGECCTMMHKRVQAYYNILLEDPIKDVINKDTNRKTVIKKIFSEIDYLSKAESYLFNDLKCTEFIISKDQYIDKDLETRTALTPYVTLAAAFKINQLIKERRVTIQEVAEYFAFNSLCDQREVILFDQENFIRHVQHDNGRTKDINIESKELDNLVTSYTKHTKEKKSAAKVLPRKKMVNLVFFSILIGLIAYDYKTHKIRNKLNQGINYFQRTFVRHPANLSQ